MAPGRRGPGTFTIRIGEMPEAGKAAIMERIEREVRAVVAVRPDLSLEVVIDGAADLRTHLLERFPDARHLTDFFHVAEHLAEALRLLFPSDAARRAEERARWCHKLKHKRGTPFRLWRWLRHARSPPAGCWQQPGWKTGSKTKHKKKPLKIQDPKNQ